MYWTLASCSEFCIQWPIWRSLTTAYGEGNGTPLQCSCLDNPRDGGAWWAAIYGVTQSRTRLKQLSSSSSNNSIRWTLYYRQVTYKNYKARKNALIHLKQLLNRRTKIWTWPWNFQSPGPHHAVLMANLLPYYGSDLNQTKAQLWCI